MTNRDRNEPPAKLPQDFGGAVARPTSNAPVDETIGAKRFEHQIVSLLSAFEDARHEAENGAELWFARDLMRLFDYATWNKFRSVIARAWASCGASGIDAASHFVRMDGQAPWNPEEVFSQPGKNPRGGRPLEDVILSRRAAYLIAENGDPAKLTIAVAQRYFTEQARRQEIADQSIEALTEDQRRVLIREEVTEQNKGLASAANSAGVSTPKDFAIFQTEGYRGMYGGLNVDGIKRAKGIAARDQILDRMGSTELAANLFRLTQTEERLRQGDIKSKAAANRTHREIGDKVRKTMIEISGTPPEQLGAADHIKHARKRLEAIDAPPSLTSNPLKDSD